jgi:selenocysteine-specific elongation factor
MMEIEKTFEQVQLAPPTRESLSQGPLDNDLIELLIETKRLVSLQNVALRQSLVFHTDTLAAAAEALSDAFPTPQSFTTGEARTALRTSRKIIVPILEYFDAQGVTIRKGDARQMIAANVVSPLS